MVLTAGLRNLKDTGRVLRTDIFALFADEPLELALADGAMALSTWVVLPLQRWFARGEVKWGGTGGGCWIQHALQAAWLGGWVYLPFFLGWQW